MGGNNARLAVSVPWCYSWVDTRTFSCDSVRLVALVCRGWIRDQSSDLLRLLSAATCDRFSNHGSHFADLVHRVQSLPYLTTKNQLRHLAFYTSVWRLGTIWY